ncbi:MAG: MAPEG family protein [Rheinheimera sp.]|nr:MAPEG family protein [Rheinheimera sp.]
MDKLLIVMLFLQVLLTSGVMVLMGRRRFAAARNKEFHYNAFRTMDLAGANERVITASRNFDNQFQMPMLFFFAVLLILQQQQADLVYVCIAGLFVAMRALQFVHVTSNQVRARFNLFLASSVVLWVLWLRLVIGLWW